MLVELSVLDHLVDGDVAVDREALEVGRRDDVRPLDGGVAHSQTTVAPPRGDHFGDRESSGLAEAKGTLQMSPTLRRYSPTAPAFRWAPLVLGLAATQSMVRDVNNLRQGQGWTTPAP